MNITPIYASLLGLLFFYLSIRTIGFRRRLKISIGGNENDDMLRAMRVHANFSEYVPFVLLLIFFVEMQNAPHLLVHLLGGLLLLGRLLHAYGVSQTSENFKFRISGMALTFTALLSAIGFLMFNLF